MPAMEEFAPRPGWPKMAVSYRATRFGILTPRDLETRHAARHGCYTQLDDLQTSASSLPQRRSGPCAIGPSNSTHVASGRYRSHRSPRNSTNDGSAESRLHEAAWRGDLEEVIRLVEGRTDVNWRDSIHETVLFGAAAWGQVEVVRYLLSVGAGCNIAESNGYTSLHWAASHGNLETIKVLADAGADPTVTDHHGRLPIDVAH